MNTQESRGPGTPGYWDPQILHRRQAFGKLGAEFNFPKNPPQEQTMRVIVFEILEGEGSYLHYYAVVIIICFRRFLELDALLLTTTSSLRRIP